MKMLQIRPVYGFGWRENGVSIDTPAPFTLSVEKEEGTLGGEHSQILGKILGPHKFAGKCARLEIRGYLPPPQYNVQIYDEPLSPPQTFASIATATGFAEVI